MGLPVTMILTASNDRLTMFDNPLIDLTTASLLLHNCFTAIISPLHKQRWLTWRLQLPSKSARRADSSGAIGARKAIFCLVLGCSKLSLQECRKTLASLKGDSLDGA